MCGIKIMDTGTTMDACIQEWGLYSLPLIEHTKEMAVEMAVCK